MSGSSEEYLVTVDISDNGERMIVVCRMNSRNVKFTKAFKGEEANKVYELLTVKE